MKHTQFQQKNIHFIESIKVKEGVICDVYKFKDDASKDLAIVTVAPGQHTPLQRVVSGKSTIEGYVSGQGELVVTAAGGLSTHFKFPSEEQDNIGGVEVRVGETMQWRADETQSLVFFEICDPPYFDGRFVNLTE